MTDLQSFHDRLVARSRLLGIVLRSCDPVVAELAAASGFDFGWIDMEHSALSLREAQAGILALRHNGCAPLVRVGCLDPNRIGQLLDMGAEIIAVPHVESREEAEAVVDAARYYPQGGRGFSSTTRANRFGDMAATKESLEKENRRVLVMVQIESRLGMERIEEIAAVAGVDILFLGTGDLSQDLGVPGELRNPVVTESVERFVQAARRAKKPAALPVTSGVALQENWRRGYSIFTCGVDLALMRGAMTSLLSTMREELDP